MPRSKTSSKANSALVVDDETLRLATIRALCEEGHLFFTRYFFKQRTGLKFIVNWHHQYMSDVIDDVIEGRRKNVVITVSPGSSKTEIIVINLIARGLAKNPRARFLHLSGSDVLAGLNSSTARDIVRTQEFQSLWPMKIADDANAKKRWNVMVDGQIAGGVYATALGGQVTGFRAGHMALGWNGAVIIDDPQKPEDAFSKTKMKQANRRLATTVKSRRANPDTPIILVMQRLGEFDPVAFIKKGNLGKLSEWSFVSIPALIDKESEKEIPAKYLPRVVKTPADPDGRYSYWPYKEPLDQLLSMEAGGGEDTDGNRISRFVFGSQYQQNPKALGGNLIKGAQFGRYTVLPKLRYRMIYGDTAQKTKETNDFSVLACWGMGEDDGKLYLVDLDRGRWEAPELIRRTRAFWAKHQDANVASRLHWIRNKETCDLGTLRQLKIEDKSSGTGLIQTVKLGDREHDPIPVKEIDRGPQAGKLTRVLDALPFIEAGLAVIPEAAPFTTDFVDEHEAFSADDSHAFDDQVDTTVDALLDNLGQANKLEKWSRLAENADISIRTPYPRR